MRAYALWMLLPWVVACEDGYKPPEYAFGAVLYDCGGMTDPACDGMSPAPPTDAAGYSQLPAIARTGEFWISNGFANSETECGSRIEFTSLTPARLAHVGDEGLRLRADTSGLGAVTDGSSFDHVHVREPAEIRITHESRERSGRFDEVLGMANFPFRLPDDRFRAVLVDNSGEMLAGAVACSWTSTNPSVMEVRSDPSSHIVEFSVVGSGTATLVVEMAGLSNEVPFTIN